MRKVLALVAAGALALSVACGDGSYEFKRTAEGMPESWEREWLKACDGGPYEMTYALLGAMYYTQTNEIDTRRVWHNRPDEWYIVQSCLDAGNIR